MVVRLVVAERRRKGTVKVLKAYRVCVKKKRAGGPERASIRESDRFRFLGVRAARLRLKYCRADDDPAPTHSGLLPLSRSRQAPLFRSQDSIRHEQPEA
ncbi:hypothetical protein [Burkholderia sp. MSMB1835]|uniref:hypothetical protein n=1 Tax=Burkholderia sp. MSMB1835 TaxID=1637876 RepID=UPI0012E35F09|nr:hypothetical protein [Burkholderia sp. MSMB1835]